jgi:hypothetical protein
MATSLDDMLSTGPKSIALGVQDFDDSLRAQGADVLRVAWSPPADGDPELMDILDALL